MNLATLWTLIIEQRDKQTGADAESKKPLCVIVCRILMSAPGSLLLHHPYVQGHIHMTQTASATVFPINRFCLCCGDLNLPEGFLKSTAITKKLCSPQS